MNTGNGWGNTLAGSCITTEKAAPGLGGAPDWLFWVAGSTAVFTAFGVVCTIMCIR